MDSTNCLTEQAIEAIVTLAALNCMYDRSTLPGARELADDALDYAAADLHDSGLLATLNARAAKQYWPRFE